MKNQHEEINIQLFISHYYLIDEILNDYLEKNPDVKFNRKKLIDICEDALRKAIDKYDPQKDGLFNTFATPIILAELKIASFLVNFTISPSGKNTQNRVKSFNDQNCSYSVHPRLKTKHSYSKTSEIDLNLINLSYYTDEFKSKKEEGFLIVKSQPLSTFSINVDTASYGMLRKQILRGKLPKAESVRTEELVNYFKYKYPQPENNEQIAVSCETGVCPWQHKHRIVKIAIKAKEIETEKLPVSHFVFLIDVSASMEGANRLELVKFSLKRLTDQLRDIDKISVVVFSNEVSVLIKNESGENKRKIKDIIGKLYAFGGTYGEGAIQKAYEIAKKYFIENGNNRVVLCTDGDFNIGVSDEKGAKATGFTNAVVFKCKNAGIKRSW